jgi:hypothetical protein
MGVEFVHIGLMKTASTYMQNLWIKDPAYALSWSVYSKQIEQIRNRLRNGKTVSDIELKIAIDGKYNPNQSLVVSHEGFSAAFINEPEHQEKIPEFIEVSSKLLKQVDPENDNLLIVVREPLAWIKSVYIQAVKQGGYGSAQDFVNEQAELIAHGLNLKYIVYEYGKHFENILVLPFECFCSHDLTLPCSVALSRSRHFCSLVLPQSA